jgi:Peptidase A4 family
MSRVGARTTVVATAFAASALAALAASALAALVVSASAAVTPNWAGYAVTSPAGETVSFTRVAGVWTEPSVTCTAEEAGTASAVWVGLGGYRPGAHELEQVGTNANCDASAHPTYFAWFEVVPYPATTIELAVRPGDTIAASVAVLPGTARLRVEDRTRGWTFARDITWASPDTSSAEWVVEAPATCVRFSCSEPRLADFGSVTIRDIAATGNGHTGTLAGNAWKVTRVELAPGVMRVPTFNPDAPTPAKARATSHATPGPVEDSGTAFTVSTQTALGT